MTDTNKQKNAAKTSNQEAQKRKSAVPSVREWEELNFRYAAFYMKLACCKDPALRESLKDRLIPLQQRVMTSPRKRGDYILIGYESVLFFLQHPQYIAPMKREIMVRRAERRDGGATVGKELNTPELANHCRDKALHIFTHGSDDYGNNYQSDRRYLHIYNSYAEIMGRACWAAEEANRWAERFQENARVQAAAQAEAKRREEAMKAAQSYTSQDFLPGFVMPPAEVPERPKRVRKYTRKFRLPDHVNDR